MQVGTTKYQVLYNKPLAAVHPGALAAGTLPQYNTSPAPSVQEAGWASGTVWTGAQNPVPTPELNPRTVHPTARRYTHITKVYKGSKTIAPL